jgi:hypothetical protein
MTYIQEHRSDDGDVFKYLVMDSGRRYTHNDCEHQLKLAGWTMQRWFARALATLTDWRDPEDRKLDIEHLRWRLDDIAAFVEGAQQELDQREGVSKKAERIAKLRNVTGRTPEEAAAFLAKAALLEGES